MNSRKQSEPVKTKHRSILFWAWLICTIWMLFYAAVMYWQVGAISFPVALIASANYNYIFAAISILIWQICKRFPFDKINKILFVSAHFFLAIVFSVWWLSLSYGFWYLAEGNRIFERVQIREIIGWQFLFGMIQYFLVIGISYTIIYYRTVKKKELEQAELKILTRDAELKALRLQMNPHFLFNSLNSINALVTKDPALARKMIAHLSELLRMSLESHDKLMIPLKQELDLVHTYLAIEQMRFGDKMVVQEKIDPSLLTHPFPAMMLQPLLENAVKHGIANTRSGGRIALSLKQSNKQIVGIVMNATRYGEPSTSVPGENSRIALQNIRQRLDRMYGKNYLLDIDQVEQNQFKVEFRIPLSG